MSKQMPVLQVTHDMTTDSHTLELTRWEASPNKQVERTTLGTYSTDHAAQMALSALWRGMCDAHQRGYEAAHAERDRQEGI